MVEPLYSEQVGQAGTPDPSLDVLPTASTFWQSDVNGQQTRARSDYLLTTAAMTPIQQAAARARALLQLTPGAHVLDIGCGNGVSLPDLAAAVAPGGHVTGVDHAEDLLDDAQRFIAQSDRATSIALRFADAHSLPFPDNSFGAAHISRVLIHVEDPDIVLREAHRVVKPGGWVVVTEPDFNGMRIDHFDPEAAQLFIAAQSTLFRHPAAGIELARRLTDVGFVERSLDWLTWLESDYDHELTPYYRHVADIAVAKNLLSRERAHTVVDAMIAAGERGCFVSYSTLITAAGRVPGA